MVCELVFAGCLIVVYSGKVEGRLLGHYPNFALKPPTRLVMTAILGISAFYLAKLSTAGSVLALVQAVCVFMIIILLERAGRS